MRHTERKGERVFETCARGVPLAPLTTIGVGGKAAYFAAPATREEFVSLYDEETFVLGRGSNVVISDGGYGGLVLSTANLNGIKEENGVLTAECGVTAARLVDYCRTRGLGGTEFLFGIPASVGGLAAMNAGAFGREMKDVLRSVVVWDGAQKRISVEDCGFSYRKSGIKGVVLAAEFNVAGGFDETFIKKIADFRREKQPHGKTFGSTFRNGEGYSAGALVERAGLKGFSVGGARVSEKHANFILNTGGATAKDVRELILYIKRKVNEKFGVELAEEVRFIGEFE